jgi:acyl-coenzyme A thioesterase PaaI-like protein
MIGRTRPEILRDALKTSLKGLAQRVGQKVLEQAPAVVEELRALARNPRALGTWLEGRSPWLNRQFLGAASNLIEPFTLGMGLKVEHLSEDSIEASLPGGWKNRGEGGAVHSAALSALGEFAVRLFWEHHLDLRHSEVEVERVQVRILSRPFGDLKGVFRLPEADREAILHRLRADGEVNVETQTHIYDRDGRLIAEVDGEWRLKRQLALGAAGSLSET